MTGTDATRFPSTASRSRRLLAALMLFAIAVAGLALGARRVPAPPLVGEGFSSEPLAVDAESRIIRLATFNIARGRGKDGVTNLSRTAEQLKGYDLVGLNEVGAGFSGATGSDVQLIGDALHMPWLYAPTEWRFWRPHFGNGALSMLPVKGWVSVPLVSTQAAGHRNVVVVQIERGGTVVNVMITHLDRGPDRQAQLAAVATLFRSLAEPAVLMGDLNTRPSDRLLEAITSIPGVREPLAEIADASPGRIDYIFTRGLETRDAGTEDEGASDHPLVWAEVVVPAEVIRDARLPADGGGNGQIPHPVAPR